MLVLVPNQARDVSLNTNVVTHQDNKECKKTTALLPSLLFLFFLLFLSSFFQGSKTLLFSITTTQTMGLLKTAPLKSDQHLNFQTAGHESNQFTYRKRTDRVAFPLEYSPKIYQTMEQAFYYA